MVIQTNLKCELQKAVRVQYLNGNLFSQDNQGNQINVEVLDGGSPATLSGTVSANVIRADGGTVAVSSGSFSGNVASVVLPAAAYAVPGVVSIIIKITSSGVITTLAAIVANVYQSSTDTAVDPGTIIPSIQTLISSIETAVASIPADYSSLWTSLAPAFNSSNNYTAGQYVTYSGSVYMFKTNHSGAWSASDVSAVDIGGQLSQLKNSINDTINGVISLGEWIANRYITSSGNIQNYSGWKATDFIEIGKAEKLYITASAGSSGAYNAFYDSSKSHVGSNFTFAAGENEITIPSGAVYFRLSMPNAVVVDVKWWLAVTVTDTATRLDETLSALDDNDILSFQYREIGEWTWDCYINTNVSVGTVVSMTPVESSNYGYKKVSCVAGDKFSVSGQGGNNPRLWAFTDVDYKLIDKTASTSGQQTNVLLTAPDDGYLIVNSYSGTGVTYSVKKYQAVSDIEEALDEKLDRGFYSLNDIIKNSNPGRIGIGDVGDTIDYTPTYNADMLFGIFPVSQGDVFKITGSGGNIPRLWCFVDSSDVIVSKSAADLTVTDLILTAPGAGKLIVNVNFRNYNVRKKLASGGETYEQSIEKASYDYRNNGLDILSAFSNVTCCGDSLTASVVYTHDNGDGTHQTRSAYKKYPWILGQKIGAEAESVATGGYSVTEWWAAYASRIVQKDNHLVIIYLGTNGGLTDTLATDAPGTDYTQYANTNTGNYCKMVAKSLEVGARVLLIKIHHGGGGDTFLTNDVIDKIAAKFSVAVVDVPELQERKYHAFPDNTGTNDLHYNDLGYAAFAEALIRNVGNLSDEMAVRLIPV